MPDHSAVVSCFNIDSEPRGQGYWKLNVSILEDSEFKEGISCIIRDAISEYEGVSSMLVWELIKLRVREFSIKYSQLKHRKRNRYVEALENTVNKIKQILVDGKGDTQCLKDRKEALEREINTILSEKALGAQIRARAKWIEKGEKSTSYFLRLEKHHQSSNTIKGLRNENNEIIYGSKKSLTLMREFYMNLYSSRDVSFSEIQEYFADVQSDLILSKEHQKWCEGLISVHDCEEALKKMKKNKSPGLDGLPAEFYQTFWQDIKQVLVNAYNECFEKGELLPSQRKSVLSLIYKKGDKYDIKNYRPISLINADYKILASVLAKRLKSVLPFVIHTDQTGFIENRYIGSNVRLVSDIIEYADAKLKGGALIMLDFEKAFDSLEWRFLEQSLAYFNFGPEFMKWVKVLYKHPIATIKNNNFLSEDFNLSRGVRQGCPLSAPLFTVAVEVLAIKIRQTNSIVGFPIPNEMKTERETKLSQYADDTIIILGNALDTDQALNIIKKYGQVSGLRLNLHKTVGVPLGVDKENIPSLSPQIAWTLNPVKVLGVYVGGTEDECNKLNWDGKITNLERLLNSWKQRNLSLFGKITIIKTLALPNIIYCASMAIVPPEVYKKIEKLVYGFIWNSKDRIKRNQLINKIEEGGLNMVDIKSRLDSLKAIWVKRILTENNNSSWNRLPRMYFNTLGLEMISHFNFCDNNLHELNQIPEFYMQAVVAFSKAKDPNKVSNQNELTMQILWGNHLFTVSE